jgi:hypothetical protein
VQGLLKVFCPFLIGIFVAGNAAADIFDIKNEQNFTDCMSSDHLIETKGDKVKQSKYLSSLDIQERCISAAKKHLAKEKDPKVIANWIAISNKYSHRDNAIDLIGLQVKLAVKTCNDKDIYDRVMSIMAMPSKKDPESLYQRGWNVIRTCLKDKQFKEDFMDEQDSSKSSYQYTNVCEVLMGEKLIKKCK